MPPPAPTTKPARGGRGHTSLNDPDTNACGYKGLSGQPRGPSRDQRRASQQEPATPDRRLPSAQQAGAIFDGVEDLLEAERPTSPFGRSVTAAGVDEDLFRFREKGAIAGTEPRREVERQRRGPAGGGRGGGGSVATERSAVKVELATQLGVPAASTYEEVMRDETSWSCGAALMYVVGGFSYLFWRSICA